MDLEYFTVAEVAQKLKVTPAAVYKWMSQGRLEYVFVGDDRRVTNTAIEAFIKASGRSKGLAADDTIDEGTLSPSRAAGFTTSAAGA